MFKLDVSSAIVLIRAVFVNFTTALDKRKRKYLSLDDKR